MTARIARFQGAHAFLSNFFPCQVSLPDDPSTLFPSTEHAYQAAKTLDIFIRRDFLTGTAGQAKRLGRVIAMRSDWEEVKLSVMESLLHQKFRKGSDLAIYLERTGDAELIEGNTWGDRYWGMTIAPRNGDDKTFIPATLVGQNQLGKLLMKVREMNRAVSP